MAVAGAFLVVALGWAGAGASPAPPTVKWSTATPPASPPPLAYATAAYDADNSTVVLFGGIASDGTLSGSTWVWNGSTWTEPKVSPSPPARELASMAFDPSLHQLILFGGQGPNGALLGDTWAWNGRGWYQVAADGPSPGPREAAAMAYDHSGSLLLFGGTGPAPGSTPTSSTTLPGLGSSPPVGTDTVLDDTWLWTSAGWVHSTAGGPPARSGAAMAYDQSNGTTLLFGGEATPTSTSATKPLADTWVWNGSGWAATKPSTSPPARFGAAADAFPGLGGVLLVAGEGSQGADSDAWVWTGSTWTQAQIQGSSTPRMGAAAAYDSATRSMVVFGGAGGGGAVLGDTSVVSVVAPPPPPTTVKPTTSTTASKPTTSTTAPRSTSTTGPATTTSRGTGTANTSTTLPQATGVGHAPAVTLRSDHQQVKRGASVQLSGAGFAPGSVVTLTFQPDPTPLGTAVVAANGTFLKMVTIPDGAAPGEHYFLATGRTTGGVTADLTAAVTVLGPHHKGISTVATLSLVGLAILIPVATYLGMAGLGLWRRRGHPAG